jgi:hypothetical protein
MSEHDVLKRAKGRCECRGQCGENHAWAPKLPARQCRAPNACKLVRLKANPSYWALAGPDLAYPELYRDKVVGVQLSAFKVGRRNTALCQRCRLLIEKAKG